MKKCTFIYLWVILFSSLPALAASFTADLVMTEKGKTETGKFYLLDQRYRMDLIEEGKPIVVIADKEKNIHRFLDMEGKVFFDIPSDDFRILSNDPFKASEYMVSKYEAKVQSSGSEKISGFVCEKQDFFAYNEHIHAARWVSTEFGFPLKLVTYHQGKEVNIAELKDIRNVRPEKDLFVPPAGFKQVEEPGAAAKRKSEEQERAEAALPGITKATSAQVPCYVKIAAGGELHVPIDTDRKADLDVINEDKGESVYTVLKYRDGKPLEGYEPKQSTLEGKGRNKNWDFNDDFDRRTGASIDELRITVAKGLVYAVVRQKGPVKLRKDFYNRGHLSKRRERVLIPKDRLTVKITGDNPFGRPDHGKILFAVHESGAANRMLIPFTVENGKTLTWDYPASKGIKRPWM